MPLCKQVVLERAQSYTCYPGCSLSRQAVAKRTAGTQNREHWLQMVPERRGLLNCFLTAICDPKTILLLVLLPYQQDCAAQNPEI